MTALAEKLKDAGADTIGAKLTAACTEALRQKQNVADAWLLVGKAFGHEFLRSLARDMEGPIKAASTLPSVLPPVPRYEYQKEDNRSYSVTFSQRSSKPRIVAPERIERRRRLQEIVRSRFKNSAGVSWSEVSWHELTSLDRDGREAAALLKAGPAHVPNDGRTVGQVLGVEQVDVIIQRTREA